jgi:hypothetical protein
MSRSVLALVLLCSFGALHGQELGLNGDLRTGSLAFYVVHGGGPLRLALTVSRPEAEPPDHGGIRLPYQAFWQVFDAEERPLKRGFEQLPSAKELTRQIVLARLPETAPGIYQVRCAQTGTTVRLDANGAPYGVLACRSRQAGVQGGWLYVPEGSSELSFNTYAATVTAYSEAGDKLGDSRDKKAIAVSPGQVVRLAIAYEWESGAFGIQGVPGILCPSAELARRIHGSVETSADGRHFAHKFQVRMWNWMRARKPADFAVQPVALEPLADQWLADPRNAGLLGITGPFNFVPRILQEQDLDPASKTYGLGTVTSWLGPAYVIDKPFNPYRRNPAILNRLVLQEFAYYLKLAENGTFNGNDWDHYAGGDGLGFRKRSFQFGYVAPHVPPELRHLWFEGAEKVMDCMGLRRVTCENQTSHWLLDHYLLYLGSGQEVYRRVAHAFAAALESPQWNSFMRTGYDQERYGPDATYQGLCAAQQAIYYRYSNDTVVRDGLQRVYDLFNHTIAPEPDGTLRGASNFSHRTSGSWVSKQYNAGVRLMADQLPEAGVWYRNEDPAEAKAKALDRIRRYLTETWDDDWFARNERWYKAYAYHPWTAFFHEYIFPTGPIKKGNWPALSPRPFFENRNNEFVFAKRDSYYAVVYAGKTSHDWVRKSIVTDSLPKGWVKQDGAWVPTTASAKKNAWTPTQGLSLLWIPGYGNWLVGKNWHVHTIQGTRADLAEDKVAWPDYYSCESQVDEKGATVTQDLRLFDQPVRIHRQVVLAPDAVRLDVSLTAEADFSADRLVEQFPFLAKEGLAIRCRVGEEWQTVPAPSTGAAFAGVSAVQFRNDSGAGVELTFADPVDLAFGTPSRHHRQVIGLLEVAWGKALQNGETRHLSCRIAAIRQ